MTTAHIRKKQLGTIQVSGGKSYPCLDGSTLAGTLPSWSAQKEIPVMTEVCMRACALTRTDMQHAAMYMTKRTPFKLCLVLMHPAASAGFKPRFKADKLL